MGVVVCKIPLLARRTRPRPSARATIGYIVYNGRGCPAGTGGHPEPPQKFGHGPLYVGQLLSRNQVSQNNQGEPLPPPPPPPPPLNPNKSYYINVEYKMIK